MGAVEEQIADKVRASRDASTQVEIIYASTADGIRLEGSLQRPPPGCRHPGLDAILCLHGSGGNFYGAVFGGIFPRLLSMGVSVLRPNLRSHDIVARLPALDGERIIGSAYENVDECRLDIAAWVQALAHRGLTRIGLLGHCMGAIKALYSQAFEPLPEVKCLAAISPVRFSYSWYQTSYRQDAFREQYAIAERHVREGRGRELMIITAPYQLIQSAECYLDQYGPEERYNFLKFAGRVACPHLIVFGEIELQNSYSFAGLDRETAALPDRSGRRTLQIVPGANHFYKGKEVRAALEETVEKWFINEHNWHE